MKKTNTPLAVLAALCVLGSANVYSAGVDLTAIGPRAHALGGNFRGVADDWSAMYWNPAGLVFTGGIQAGFGLEFASPKITYAAAEHTAGMPFSGTRTGESVRNEPLNFVLPSLGVYYSNEKYAFGIGAWAPFGLGAKWDLLKTDVYNSNYPEFEWHDNLQVIDIHPTFSYKINDRLSVGVGASLIFADITIRKPMFSPNPYIFDQQELRDFPLVGDQIGTILDQLPRNALTAPYDHLITETDLNGSGSGFGANFGVMFQATECLTLGLTGKWYNPIRLDGTITATSYFAVEPAANEVLSPLNDLWDLALSSGEVTELEHAVLSGMYTGKSYNQVVPEKIEAELALPNEVGFGLCYTGLPKLQVSADISISRWSAWDTIAVSDKKDGEIFAKLVQNWNDGIRLGVGLEYKLLPMLNLRGAFYTEPAAAVPETMNPTLPDVNRRNVGLIGVGIAVSPKLMLHAIFEKMFIDDLTVGEWRMTEDRLDYENMAGTYTLDVMTFMVGLDYKL